MATKTFIVPIHIIAIEEDGFHLTLDVVIEGKKALLLIDTGASRSVFDVNRVRNFIGEQSFEPHDKLSTGLGTNSMITHTTEFKSFKIGQLSLPGFIAVLLDLTHVNESYTKLGLNRIDGVIGSDLLFQFDAIIDYGNRQLQLNNKVSQK